MNNKTLYLKIYLYFFGCMSLFVISTIPIIFGNFFLWKPRNLPTEIMMSSPYLTMGVVTLFAAHAPEKHKAFMDFLILANILHALVMWFTAQNTQQIILDAIPIEVMGILPLIFYPWSLKKFLVSDDLELTL